MLKQRNDTGLNGKELEVYNAIQPRMYLYGYCCGRFGRDSYGDKLVLSKTINSVRVLEDGIEHSSFEIHSWDDLIQSSNYFLEQDYE